MSKSSVWYDFIFDNAYQQDAGEAERRIRSKYPHLLHEKEHLELAFKDRGGKGRDKEYFTTHRILIKDGKGVGSKRKNYRSIPYRSIQAFSVDTAGKFDGDVSVKIYSSGIPFCSIDFANANVDIYQIQQFLNSKLCSRVVQKGQPDEVDSTPPNMEKKQTTLGNIIDWFGDNAKQVSAKEAETKFKTEMPVLLENERVELVFRSGRDYTVFTDRRVMLVDVQGVYGKKIVFQTILWESIKAYAVQTAGAFLDRDMEMYLYTDIVGSSVISQDFRHGKADLFAIQKVYGQKILVLNN